MLVENRPAIQVMQYHDLPDTLHYVDPPYLHSTRDYHTTQNGSYAHEMTDNEHLELLNVLLQLKGSIVLSGYDNELYNDILTGWKKETKDHYASGQKGGTKRTEILWIKSHAPDLGLF